MGPPMTWLHLVPQLVLATALFLAAAVLWFRGGRTPALNALSLLLVFRGHLSLVSAVAWVADADVFAVHLWPMFEIATIITTLAFMVLLYADLLDERQLDAILSSIIGGGALVIVLLIFIPDLFWGDGVAVGPLAFLSGLRTSFWALLAWILLRRALTRHLDGTGIRPRFAYLLAVAFFIPAVHWGVTDLFYIQLLRIDSIDLVAAADHHGRLVAGFVVLVVFALLYRASRQDPQEAVRSHCRRAILLGLLPALLAIFTLNLHMLGWIGPDQLGLIAASALPSLWTLTLPVAVTVAVAPPQGRPWTSLPAQSATPYPEPADR